MRQILGIAFVVVTVIGLGLFLNSDSNRVENPSPPPAVTVSETVVETVTASPEVGEVSKFSPECQRLVDVSVELAGHSSRFAALVPDAFRIGELSALGGRADRLGPFTKRMDQLSGRAGELLDEVAELHEKCVGEG